MVLIIIMSIYYIAILDNSNIYLIFVTMYFMFLNITSLSLYQALGTVFKGSL